VRTSCVAYVYRRFVCRDRIGERQQCSAAFLPAIPQDAVVYGAGASSVILTKVRTRNFPQKRN